MTKRGRRFVVAAAALVGLALFVLSRQVCLSTWWKYRIVVRDCPDGKLRQTLSVEASGLRRGAAGTVFVEARAHYTVRDPESELDAPVTSFTATLALYDAATQKYTRLPPAGEWKSAGNRQFAEVKLPDVPDGDYHFIVKVFSRVGDDSLDLPLPLYAPARVHVVTDRPLYEPGHTVRFRAVVLRARDLTPLDGRPGRWVVTDPANEVVLEEKAPAGAWGVASGSLPLDKGAATGTWRVAWVSGDATDEVPITVEPFTLPRFRVEAAADRPFYRPGERPVIRGSATYSSGAPVAGARVALSYGVEGDWPPPTEWQDGALPAETVTGPSGAFQLDLPTVPSDLLGQATLRVRIAVVDAAGDRVQGTAAALLSQDGIQASAVTELADGLVAGFNNRLYLRVATADGRALPGGTKIVVRRAWAAGDRGMDATLDEDGVASLQVDPGPPVNVVIPAAPYRPPPRRKPVVRRELRDLIAGGAVLDDQLAVDRWLPALAPCAKWVAQDEQAATVGLRVDEGGRLAGIVADAGPLGACVAEKLAALRLPPGVQRAYAASFAFSEPDAPRLEMVPLGSVAAPPGLVEKLRVAARGARDCLPAQAGEGVLARAVVYRTRAGRKEVELAWIRDPSGVAGPAADCVEARLRGLALDTPAPGDGMGVARFRAVLPERLAVTRPQPTVVEGYELLVAAGGESTRLRMSPGTVPALRLRATPVLAQPGDTVTVELIRGPSFRGELPKTAILEHLRGRVVADIDRDTRTAKLTLDAQAEGWCQVDAGGAHALVFVRPRADLAVTVTPEHPRYAPGQDAVLAVRTTAGGQGGPAAVGLFGVDESLGQLASLRGPDDMGRVRPPVTMSAPAFGAFDGQALTLGRVRGANAAAATILRVTGIPRPPELDATIHGNAATMFDPTVELTDRFYVVLAELHASVRRWEAEAPGAEKMTPFTMAGLWQRALDGCVKRGERVDDAFGRPLRLHRLPADLLALTDPREVVMVGTRLPEDIESWPAWVARVRP